MAKSFRELRVWNKAMDLATTVYALTGDFPKQEVFGLSSQMRRAAVSIPSNIAEGSARGTRKDFKQFIAIARGSNCELQTQLALAKRLEFGNLQKLVEADELSRDVGQMLSGLSKFLSSSRTAGGSKDSKET